MKTFHGFIPECMGFLIEGLPYFRRIDYKGTKKLVRNGDNFYLVDKEDEDKEEKVSSKK